MSARPGPACSLPEPERLARRRWLRRSLAGRVRVARGAPGRAELRFAAGAETRRLLEEMIGFERGCCAELRFALEEADGELCLRVNGPGAEVFAEAARAGVLPG